MPNPANLSEQWFDEYLGANGYRFTVEPDLRVRTRPDRLIERSGVEAICEVKEFTTDAMNRRWPEGGAQMGAFSTEEWLLNVRRAITSAARQLEPLAGDPRPLVILLANPHSVVAEIAGPKLIEAMHGDLMITFQVNTETGEPASEPEWTLGEGGRLGEERAPWVSAVAGLHRGDRQRDWMQSWIEQWKAEHWPEKKYDTALARFLAYQEELEQALEREDVPTGEYFYLDVVEAMSHEAVSLPRTIFDGERDRRWIVNRDARVYELLP